MCNLSQALADLSSAEDFFAYFDVPFDPRVMAVCRLHILKRFRDSLGSVVGLESLDDAAKRDVYRRQLASAYSSFAAGAAPNPREFPGLARTGGGFVALSQVRPGDKLGATTETRKAPQP